MPSETISVAGQNLKCRVRSVQADGEFPEYGRGVSATVSENEIVPGGLVRVRLKATKGDQRYEFLGVVTEYHISSKAAGD